jgi:hypothetical protein
MYNNELLYEFINSRIYIFNIIGCIYYGRFYFDYAQKKDSSSQYSAEHLLITYKTVCGHIDSGGCRSPQ